MAPQKLQRMCSRRPGVSVNRLLQSSSRHRCCFCSNSGPRPQIELLWNSRTALALGLGRRSASGSTDSRFSLSPGTTYQLRPSGRTAPSAQLLTAEAVLVSGTVPVLGRPMPPERRPTTSLLPTGTASQSRTHSVLTIPRSIDRPGPFSLVSPHPSPRSCRQFTTSSAMGAQILDGNAIAKSIRERIGKEIVEKQKLNGRYKPCLKIIQGASPH